MGNYKILITRYLLYGTKEKKQSSKPTISSTQFLKEIFSKQKENAIFLST